MAIAIVLLKVKCKFIDNSSLKIYFLIFNAALWDKHYKLTLIHSCYHS